MYGQTLAKVCSYHVLLMTSKDTEHILIEGHVDPYGLLVNSFKTKLLLLGISQSTEYYINLAGGYRDNNALLPQLNQ